MDPKKLQSKISNAMLRSAFDNGREFFPASALDQLCLIPGKEEAKRVMAILLYIGNSNCFETLYEAGLRDKHLPLSIVRDDNSSEDSDDENEDMVVSLESTTGQGPFVARSLDGRRFVREQWLFLSPVFGGPDLEEINPSCALPIISKSEKKRKGSYSTVFKVEVHPAHIIGDALTAVSECGSVFALKQLTSDSEKEFEQEKDALRRIHRLRHRHLIRVVSSFSRGHEFFFLFPWAEEGDLWQVWKSKSTEKREIGLLKWSFEQMRGIASAVRKLHYPSDDPISEENGRHGDLRPQNILLFLDRQPGGLGTLCITDCGLAKIHELRTDNRVQGTNTSGGDQQYAPPGCRKGTKRSRKYDIWSLGCLYLEFVTWILGGMEEIERFQKERNTKHSEYYQMRKSGRAEPLPEVTKWIQDIRGDPRCQGANAVRDLLGLIEDHLLQVDEEKRYNAVELDQKFDQILDSVSVNKGYVLNSRVEAGFLPSRIERGSWFRLWRKE